MDMIEKFSRLHRELTKQTRSRGFNELPIALRVERLMTLCAKSLRVQRVSLWSINPQHSAITCECLFLANEARFESGAMLHRDDFPDYFSALLTNRLIDANDAREDPRTREFAQSYLKPLDIFSMLDAPVFSQGELYGVVCIEHTGEQREWDIAEMSFAAAVADTITLINEQQAWLNTQDRLQVLEQADSLTSLENRRFFNQRLLSDLESHPQDNSRTLMVLGLDHFTDLNDQHGSMAADSVLQVLADRYRLLSRRHNLTVARLGGDQFAFWVQRFVPEAKLDELIGKIQQATAKPISLANGSEVTIEASMGIAVYPNQDVDITDPIRCAELALQRSKKTHRGQSCFFLPGWVSELQSRQTLEKELRQAFEQRQYVAFYQPIVNAATGHVAGIEALVRWQHPERGLVPPFGFLPLLAEMGLMEKLGDYMLDLACADLKKLQKKGFDLEWVAVNLSSEQLYSSQLVESIETVLKRHNLDSAFLQLEVVEELFSQDSELISSKLQALSELGISLSIDDFGTGYSSLSRLKHLPVSKLKIDKSFVDGLPASDDDICISRSIIGLAKGMEVDIVAEGVERMEQAQWLLDHGCDYIQGYYFSKPLPFDELVAYIRRANQHETKEDGGFAIDMKGDVLDICIYGHWTGNTVAEFYQEIDNHLDRKRRGQGEERKAAIYDMRRFAVAPKEVQIIARENTQALMQRGLDCEAFIVGDSDLIRYQVELMAPQDPNFKFRFFSGRDEAIDWLDEEGFALKDKVS